MDDGLDLEQNICKRKKIKVKYVCIDYRADNGDDNKGDLNRMVMIIKIQIYFLKN